MKDKTSRDLENERQELIRIMLKNIPEEIIALIKTIQDEEDKAASCLDFSISTEGTSYAK